MIHNIDFKIFKYSSKSAPELWTVLMWWIARNVYRPAHINSKLYTVQLELI